MRLYLALLLSLALIAGCGGRSPVSPMSPSTQPPATGGSNGSATAPVQTMRVVSVGSGQSVTSIDIAVASAANASGPNAELLGVSGVNESTTARNSGASIPRGSTMKVVLFGRALSGALTVTIGGPNDIIVSNVRSVTASDGTAGIAFDATVSAGAALGARTVYLRSANDDITAFAGGLEVVP